MVEKQTVREAQIENATFIINIPTDDGGNIRKGIRHAMDSPKHEELHNNVFYVYDDYDFKVISREDYLEIIITEARFDIRLHRYINTSKIKSAVINILYRSENIKCIGNFDIKEHYLIKASTNHDT